MKLIYEELVREYLETLNAKLRNFVVERRFLETWVHDEDDHASLAGLFAAAHAAGAPELSVAVGAKTASRLDRARLESLLKPFGATAIAGESDGSWTVTMRFAKGLSAAAGASVRPGAPRGGFVEKPAPARPAGELHPAYRAAVARAASSPRFEGPAPAAPAGGVVVEASEGGATLAVAVASDGTVAAARHRGASGTSRGLLDGLCAVLPGRSLREGRDHGVQRVEAAFRDPSAPPPARGIVTPRTADPAFGVPERLARAAYAAWTAKAGAEKGWNYWDDRPAAAWLALSAGERLSRARAAVAKAAAELALPADASEVVDLLNECRIVLAPSRSGDPALGPKLLKLEVALKAALDPRIEVQLESVEDRNKRAERTDRGDKPL